MYLEEFGGDRDNTVSEPQSCSPIQCPPHPSPPLFSSLSWIYCTLSQPVPHLPYPPPPHATFSPSPSRLFCPSSSPCPPSSSSASFFLLPSPSSHAYLFLHSYLFSPYPPFLPLPILPVLTPHSFALPLPFLLLLIPYQPSLLLLPLHVPTAPPIVPLTAGCLRICIFLEPINSAPVPPTLPPHPAAQATGWVRNPGSLPPTPSRIYE